MNKNMTPEELAYYQTLSKKEKIAYSLKHKSAEERADIEARRQATRKEWSDEYRASVVQKIAESKSNRTDEQKEAQLEKFRKTMSEKSPEEIAQLRQTQSENTRNQFQRMSDSERSEFSQKMSDVYWALTDEQRQQRIDKIRQTKIDRYGESYNSLSEESKQKLIQTNLEKYGVPYYCMTEDCRNAIGGNSANSGPNIRFKNLLVENNIDFECQEFVIGSYSYDFKIDDKILVEINPSITHNSTYSPFNQPKDHNYHLTKSRVALENGYRCINVWDWDNIDAIIDMLRQRENLGARECVVQEVETRVARDFINKYHIQQYAKSEINLGLFYNDELVSIMTFGKPRYKKLDDESYELIRYCSSKNITGGAQKLFKHFLNQYNPNTVVSYCDLSKFNGKTYVDLGFQFVSSAVGRHWFNIKTGKHITDNLLRKMGFDRLLGDVYGTFGKGTSNEELMLQHGFVEIYDCGQATYIWKK